MYHRTYEFPYHFGALDSNVLQDVWDEECASHCNKKNHIHVIIIELKEHKML